MNWGFLLTKIVKFTAGLKLHYKILEMFRKKTIFLSIGNSRKTFAKLSLFLSRYWSAVQNIWSNKNWLPEKCFLSVFPSEKCIWWSFFLAIGAAQPTTYNCTENWHHCKCFLTNVLKLLGEYLRWNHILVNRKRFSSLEFCRELFYIVCIFQK